MKNADIKSTKEFFEQFNDRELANFIREHLENVHDGINSDELADTCIYEEYSKYKMQFNNPFGIFLFELMNCISNRFRLLQGEKCYFE